MVKIEYRPKRYDNHQHPWIPFGAPNKEEYDRWSPEVCGICCLKMVGDSYGLTNSVSIYQLARQCQKMGGYKESEDGNILGVFHQPLLELAESYGINGCIVRNLNLKKIKAALKARRLIALSIDKSKINPNLTGGHLILIHSYDPKAGCFLIHDPEPLLDKTGIDIKISPQRLKEFSNNRGLVFWHEKK